MTTSNSRCWCGNKALQPFSGEYLQCACCNSLALKRQPGSDVTHVTDEEGELYGKDYYLLHLPEKYGYPDLATRARTDLPERCLYWTRALLKYKLPPAKVLELGSAHGGFVAMLRWAGFDATGLELSPWIIDFAKQTFNVPMLKGPVEEQPIEPASLDVIALMDVIEHLVDPVATIRHCLRLLKPGGVILMQTPCVPEDKSYEDLLAEDDPFLHQLKEEEHLYLFSKASIMDFFKRLGVEHVVFEPALFAHYDMFLLAAKAPIVARAAEEVVQSLASSPGGRLIQSLLDVDHQRNDLWQQVSKCGADRTALYHAVETLQKELALIKKTISWKITSPFRWIMSRFTRSNNK